jgi:hypothetical protein
MSTTVSDPTLPLIQTPAEFIPKRQTSRRQLSKGQEITLFDAEGPGCIRHFWLTTVSKGWGLRIRIAVDGVDEPQVDMELNHFFGVMLDKDPYRVESPGVKVLPFNSYNCYMPIPFSKSCKISIAAGEIKGHVDARESRFTDDSSEVSTVYFQGSWQQYDSDQDLTPYRLHAYFHEELPAQKLGVFYVADLTGKGFVACMFKAIAKREEGNEIWHTGGSTWLIDGEVAPNAYRGINEEDDFNFSYGYFPYQSQWCGCPYGEPSKRATDEAVAWRFFGPDPVPFNSSIIIHFGSRADNTQTVLYYYRIPHSDAPNIITPGEWQIIGPFDATSFEAFSENHEVETTAEWTEKMDGKVRFTLKSRHGWIDPRPQYHGVSLWQPYARAFNEKDLTFCGGGPVGCAFYGRGKVNIEHGGMYILRLGFDDWLKLWVNGEEIKTFRHEKGFDVVRVPVTLKQGGNTVLVKLSNSHNREFRLWALNCVIEKLEAQDA